MKDLSVDENNRLIITERSRERTVEDEKILDSSLITETVKRKKNSSSELKRIVLDGTWQLTSSEDLILNLRGSDSRYFGKSIIFRGRITKLDANSISFRIRKSDTLSGLRTKSLQLNGVWQADEKNRLSFNVSKASGHYDTLTFQGKWDTGPNNYITYRVRETIQRTGRKKVHILALKGWWEIAGDRLIYRFYKESPGEMVFTASLQSHSLRAKEGKIRYQVGVTIEDKRRLRTEAVFVTVFGRWRLNHDLSACFWVKFGRGKVESLQAELRKIIAEKNSIKFFVRDRKNRSTEFDITFSRDILPDAKLFLSLSRFSRQNRIKGGVTIEF